MKLNKNFVKHSIDGMTLVVPVSGAEFHGVVQGNKTVGVILDCLSEDTTEEEIVNVLRERFDGDITKIKEDVSGVILRLKEIGAIDE